MTKKNRNGSTGPNTPEGKGKSSQNSIKHGRRATRVVILEGETQEDYDALREGWLTHFGPGEFAAERLVERVILNDWLVERASRWLLEAQAAVACGGDPMEWSEEKLHRLDLMLRYQTSAERAFYRSWRAAENLRKEAVKPVQSRVREKVAAVEEESVFDIGPKTPTVDQWVQVRVEEGKTVSKVTPSNERVAQEAREMIPPAEDVVRRYLFRGRVPEAYYWTTEEEQIRAHGGAVVFRMSLEEWRGLVEREKEEAL